MEGSGQHLTSRERTSPDAGVVDGEITDESTREQLVQILARAVFSGPLPPPEMLARYNEALPDGANRIVKMTEDQSSHRRKMESRGQIFAFVLAMVAILGGIFLIAEGRSIEGLVPLLAAIGGLIAVFVYGEVRARSARQIESQDKSASDTT